MSVIIALFFDVDGFSAIAVFLFGVPPPVWSFPSSWSVRSGSVELTASGGVLVFLGVQLGSPEGHGLFWWSEAALLLSNFSVGGCGIPRWWVVAVRCSSVSGFFFTLDSLRALVCFRSVEICSVFGCCFVTTAPGCLEDALVYFFLFVCLCCIVVDHRLVGLDLAFFVVVCFRKPVRVWFVLKLERVWCVLKPERV